MTDFAALPGLTPAAPARQPNSCPDCGQPVRRIWDADVGALRADVSQHPCDRQVALAVMATTTRKVYVRIRGRKHTRWRRLDQWTVNSPHLADGEHYLEHKCNSDPPPMPEQLAISLPAIPQF